MEMHDYRVGLAYIGVGSAVGLGSWFLHNVDAISNWLHVILLLVSLVTAIVGLKKAMALVVTKNVTITFPPDQLNVVVHALEQLPYKLAAPLMDQITKQVILAHQEPENVEQSRRTIEGGA